MKPFARILIVVAAAVMSIIGCSTGTIVVRGEGLDASALPAEVRSDYAVFAQRCSKCHSLTRPLNSDIDDDDY
jgi:hypothetical protein